MYRLCATCTYGVRAVGVRGVLGMVLSLVASGSCSCPPGGPARLPPGPDGWAEQEEVPGVTTELGVIILIGVILLSLMFKEPISDLIHRTTRVRGDRDGFELNARPKEYYDRRSADERELYFSVEERTLDRGKSEE